MFQNAFGNTEVCIFCKCP